MKKLLCALILLLLGNAYGFSQATLSFRYANPRILYTLNDNADEGAGLECINLVWDIEMKASAAGSRYWAIQIIQNYNAAALSDFYYIQGTLGAGALGTGATPRYIVTSTIESGNLNLAITSNQLTTSTTTSRFMSIPDTYTQVGTFMCRITDPTAVAGISFDQAGMDDQQQEKLFAAPWTQFFGTSTYEGTDLTNLYLGRVYSNTSGWSQYGGSTLDELYTDWTTAVKTSVWDGDGAITGGSESKASALRVHSEATLTIPNNGQLTVSGETDVEAANGLTIVSDGTGTGSLISNTTTGTANSVAAERYMTTGAWHLVSSPLSGQTIAGFLTGNANIATNGAARGMMDYNPTGNTWNTFFTDGTGGSLGGGTGFSMRTGTNSAVTFTGALQTGSQTVSGLTEAKWNCVGNPYTSAIGIADGSSSAVNFLTVNAANLDDSYGAAYIWNQPDASNGLSGKYTAVSNALHSFSEVQQGQAFMVKMKAGVTSVSFNQNMQIHDTDLALKSTGGNWSYIKLSALVNKLSSSTVIAFNSGMTKGLDPTYDAGLLKGGINLIVYTKLVEDNGIPFAIQALPVDDFADQVIPVGIDSKEGGEVIFSAELSDLPADCKVVLEDRLNNTLTNLSNNEVCTTTVAANYSGADRFFLHTSFQGNGISDEMSGGSLNAFAVKNIEIRLIGAVSEGAIASLYDMAGHQVLVRKLTAGNLNIISLPGIMEGVYLLNVKENSGIRTFKLPISE